MSRISARTNCGFEGSAIKGGYCQGFTELHSGLGLNRLQLQGLNILMAILSWTTLDLSWKQVPGNADHGQLPRTISDSDLWRRPQRGCFRLPLGLSFILFSLYVYSSVSFLWLVYIVKPLYYYSSFLKSTSFTSNSFPQSFLSILNLCHPSEIRTFRARSVTISHSFLPA
jgi:hypothetical protein